VSRFIPDVNAKDWHESMPGLPYELVVARAEKGPVKADWFRPHIGAFQWATFDADMYPGEINDPDDTEVAGQFFIIDVNERNDTVLIGLIHAVPGLSKIYTYVAMDINADELAIRIEDS
jgi:hypothetical protein